jgi:Fur family peroxide stress response transcriptional regulator
MSRKKINAILEDDVKRIFKEHNIKVTPQRAIIYNELKNSKNHPTATYIFKKISKKYPSISFDTVNRALAVFTEIGLIGLVEPSGEAKRFDTNSSKHHHFICKKCGKIIDFNDNEFDALDIPKEISSRFKVDSLKVVIEGLCDECSKKL